MKSTDEELPDFFAESYWLNTPERHISSGKTVLLIDIVTTIFFAVKIIQ